MSLKDKASNWQDRIVKAITMFAIVGCIILTIAVFALGKVMGDLTAAIQNPFGTPPAKTGTP